MRRESGAAAVEMALSLIVLVPTFFYVLFLDDLLRFRLDAQEAALSTVWDATVLNYSQTTPSLDAYVARPARLMFCDHTSAYDSFDTDYDCNSGAHHMAVSAHVCWKVGGGQEVECTSPDKNVGMPDDSLASDFGSSVTHGGMVTCSARAGVLNYMLPQHFLIEFERGTKMTDQDKLSGDVHSHYGANVFVFGKEQMAILTDTWALQATADVRPPGKSGELWDRVNRVYTGASTYSAFQSMSDAFINAGVAQMVISGQKDDPAVPSISIAAGSDTSPIPGVTIQQASGSGTYWATPWWDESPTSSGRPKDTWGERGAYYLGCQTEEGC